MKPNRHVKNYANALLTVSKELNCIPKTGNSLRIIDQLVKQEKVFRAFFLLLLIVFGGEFLGLFAG